MANPERNIQEEVHNVKIKTKKPILLNAEDTEQSEKKNQRNSTFHFLSYKN